MEKTGIVKVVKGSKTIIEFERLPACKDCEGCMLPNSAKMEVEADNLVSAKQKDKVEFRIEGMNMLNVSLLIYFLPLIFFLVGTGFGYLLYPYFFTNKYYQSIFAASSGIILMLIGSFFVYKIYRSRKNCKIKILKILSSERNEDGNS